MTTGRSAADLADTVLAVLPHWRRVDAFHERLPFLSDKDTENETCPRCGRRLPFTFSAAPLGGLSAPVSEYVHACLVDGPRAKDARDLGVDEILEAARAVDRGLDETECHPWHRLFDRALQGELDDERDRIEAVGQALEALRVQGPVASHPPTAASRSSEGAAWRDALAALETLVASSGPHWRSRGRILD
jgi:hypothetical protein